MPVSPHPDLKWPDNLEVKTWRYMSLSKLLSLLIEQALFFLGLVGSMTRLRARQPCRPWRQKVKVSIGKVAHSLHDLPVIMFWLAAGI